MLNQNIKVFIIYINLFSLKLIHLALKEWIILLFIEEIIIFIEYLDFADMFSKYLSIKLLKYLSINKYIINIKKFI